jgi:hypothetical protein
MNIRIAAFALFTASGAAHGGEPPATPPQQGMRQMNDGELRAVTRPLPWRLTAAPAAAAISLHTNTALYRSGDLLNTRLRALNLLTAEIEIRDVVYNNNPQNWLAARDGSYNVPLPATIGEIDIRNIRSAPSDSLSFGSVQIQGIDLQNTAITVSRNR